MKLTREYKHVSHDDMDTCANYAKLAGNSHDVVYVETIYRYGKPVYRTMSLTKFNDLHSKGLL